MTYTEADGTIVTASLKGGRGTLTFTGDNMYVVTGRRGAEIRGGSVALDDIALTAGSSRGSLMIKTKDSRDQDVEDRGADVGGISGSAILGKFMGKTTNLVGAGINLTGSGYITSLQLGDVENGADIIMNGTGALKGITIKAGEIVHSGTRVVLGSYIKSLTAIRWDDVTSSDSETSLLEAPWAASISMKGDRRKGNRADFAPNLTLTSFDPRRGASLGKFKASGTSRGIWSISRGGGSLQFGATAQLYATFGGEVKSFNIKGIRGDRYCMLDSRITASLFGSFSAAYPDTDNDGAIFGATAGSIGRLSVKLADQSIKLSNLGLGDDFTIDDFEVRLV